MKTLAIAILALTALAVGQKKMEKKAAPDSYIASQPFFTFADSPCAPDFVYDAKAKTCSVIIVLYAPSPVACAPVKDSDPQTFTCAYKPKEPK